MNGFLDWREIERRNDWGVREQTDAMGEMWNRDANGWDVRWKREEEFTKRQADALDLLPSDTVLDIGCGTGPLTVHVAPRVKKVVAQDFGSNMLGLLEANARERGLTNVETLQGNWHTMEPGRELPVCDVAIARWSPAQGNILKMSRCATRRCYSLMTCALTFEKDGASTGGYWCRSTTDEALNTSPRPCARKYGFNVHFNLLYDHGANPTVSYVSDEHRVEAATRDELVEKLAASLAPRTPAGADGAEAPGGHPGADRDRLLKFLERDIAQRDDGTWEYVRRHVIAVLGWDPREVVC